jgi:GNAT superfamily N-acetyltransferase
MTLRIESVGDATVGDWQHVHNVIIPNAQLSMDEVRERLGHYRLDVAYLDNALVGCTTVRPPDDGIATVIVRVLREHRRQGHGTQLLAHEIAQAAAMGARVLETIVLASNVDGLRFARAHGFVHEVDRYVPPDSDDPFVTLRRPTEAL